MKENLTLEQQEYLNKLDGEPGMKEFVKDLFDLKILDVYDLEGGYLCNSYGQPLDPIAVAEMYYDYSEKRMQQGKDTLYNSLDKAQEAAKEYVTDKEEKEEISADIQDTKDIVDSKMNELYKEHEETFKALEEQAQIMGKDDNEVEASNEMISGSTNNLANSFMEAAFSEEHAGQVTEAGIKAQEEATVQQLMDTIDKLQKEIESQATTIDEIRHPLRTAIRNAKEIVREGFDKAIDIARETKEAVKEFTVNRQRDVYMAADHFNNRIDSYMKEIHEKEALKYAEKKRAHEINIEKRMKVIEKVEKVKVGFKNLGNMMKGSIGYAFGGKELPPRITEVDVTKAKGFLVSLNNMEKKLFVDHYDKKLQEERSMVNSYECNIRANANKWQQFDKQNKFGRMLKEAEQSTENLNINLEKIANRGKDEER